MQRQRNAHAIGSRFRLLQKLRRAGIDLRRAQDPPNAIAVAAVVLLDEVDRLLQTLPAGGFVPCILYGLAVSGEPAPGAKARSDIQPQAAPARTLHRVIAEAAELDGRRT